MKNLVLLPLLFLVVISNAQVLTVSEEIPINSDIAYEVLGELGNHILLFRDRKTEFEVQAFNAQMRQSWSKEIELDRRLPKVLGVVPSTEDFTLIYSYRQRGNTLIKAHRYDPAANLVDSNLLINLGYLFFTPRFELIRSEDRSKALLYYVENQDMVHAYSIDIPTQSLLWERNFALQDFLYGRDFVQAIVDNRGAASFIFQKDNFRSRRKQHYYQIQTYYDGSGEPRMINIPMESYLSYDVYFEADNLNNQIVAAGLYTEDNVERARGYFYLRYQPDSNEKVKVQFTPFSEEFLQNLLGRDYREGRGLNETIAREVVLRRDGGALLIAERSKQLQRRTGTTSRVYYDAAIRSLVDFYFEEVFIVSLHPTGEVHWETILHKKQYSQDDNGVFSSYFLFETPGRLRFLFNDEIRFENTVSEYVINGLGEYDRNSLFSTTNLDLRLRFRAAIQISPNELIIPSERRNRLKLVRLTY